MSQVWVEGPAHHQLALLIGSPLAATGKAGSSTTALVLSTELKEHTGKQTAAAASWAAGFFSPVNGTRQITNMFSSGQVHFSA